MTGILCSMVASGRIHLDPYSVPNASAASAFATPSGIAWNGTYGYYENNASWGALSSALIIPNLDTDRTYKISAKIYGYYNSPSGCLGQNYILINYSGGGSKRIGTIDSYTNPNSGQTIYRGDLANLTGLNNATGQTYTATAPAGEWITSVDFYSSYLSGYAAAYRGIQDITVDYYNP